MDNNVVNLAEKLALQLVGKEKPVLNMSQLMFKRIFPNVWPVPTHWYYDELSKLDIIIDNSLPHDRIDIIDLNDQ